MLWSGHFYAICYRVVAQLISADFILENFEFKGVIKDSEGFHIELEELNTPPSEWDHIKELSKDFFLQIVIQEFPIRGHKVFLNYFDNRSTYSILCLFGLLHF